MAKIRLWTREEVLVALFVYNQIPFKDSNKHHPLIIEYAGLLDRSPSALNMKVGNLGSQDSELRKKGVIGLGHSGQAVVDLWEEYIADPDRIAYESEVAVAKLQGKSVESFVGIDEQQLPPGTEREVIVRQRVGQDFFRRAVLTAYQNHCCISGVGSNELIEACHIVDWAEDNTSRTDPHNGLCLNALLHEAYDHLLLGISPDGVVKVGQRLLDETSDEQFRQYLTQIDGSHIVPPVKYAPNPDLLARKYERFAKL